MLLRVISYVYFVLTCFVLIGNNTANALNIEVLPLTGTLKIEQTDIYFDGNQQPVEMRRIYRSDAFIGEKLGPGWSHSYDYEVKIREHKNDIVLFGPCDSVTFLKKSKNKSEENSKSEIYTSNNGKTRAIQNRLNVVVENDLNRKMYFSENGKLKKILDSKGRKVEFLNQKGLLKKVSGLFNNSVSFSYSDSSLISGVKSNFGETIDYGFYKDSRLHTVKKEGVVIELYTYNRHGLLETVTNRSGHMWLFTYDDSGRVSSITEPSKYVTRYNYNETDTYNEFITITPNGGRSITRYFKDGLKVVSVDPEGGETVSLFSKETSNLLSTKDPDGNITRYKYDKKGRLTEITAPENLITTISYHGKNDLPAKIKQADGNILEFSYDDRGNLIEHENEFKGEKKFEYDKFGRVTSITDFDGTVLKIAYGKGWLPEKIAGDKNTKVNIEYDKSGNPVHMRTGKTLISIADLKKRQEQIAKNQISANNFSQAGKMFKADDGLTEFAYDVMGDISKIRFPGGGVKTFTQNLKRQLTKISGPGKFIEEYDYSPGGLLKAKKYKDGSINYRYDGANRLKEISYPDETKTSFKRNKAGYPTLISHRGITREIDYDDQGRILSTEYKPDPETLFENASKTKVKYKYKDTEDGGVLKTVITDGHDAVYEYDPQGRLIKIDSELFGIIRYVYAESGTISRIDYPGDLKEIFQFKGNQIIHQIQKGTKLLFSEVVKTDKKGRSVSLKTNGKKSVFDYDKKGQLLNAASSDKQLRYVYDNWGNRTSFVDGNKKTKAVFNTSGQIKQSGPDTFQYDLRGNVAQIAGKKQSLTFKYGIAGELTEISSSDNKKVGYRYSENRLMLSRTEGAKNTWIVYDGLNPVMDLEIYSPEDSKESIVRRYLPGSSVGEVLAMSRLETVKVDDDLEIVEKYYYTHSDLRGNIVLITTLDGKVVSRFSYSPFGKLTASEGNVKPPLLFGAHRYEPSFDLYYMRARFYDPATGRFLSPDPDKGFIDDSLSTNPYLYVKNSPIDYNDPLGLIRNPARIKDASRFKDSTYERHLNNEFKKIDKDHFVNAAKGTLYDSYVNMLTTAVGNQTTSKMVPKLSGGFYDIVKTPKVGAEKMADNMGKFYSVGKVFVAYADLKNQRMKGLISEEEMTDQWNAELITTTGGMVVDVASAGLKLTAGKALLLGYVTNLSAERYKTAYKESGKLERAEANMVERELISDNRSFLLARKKMLQIRSLIRKGDLKSLNEANRLNNVLSDYTEKYAEKDPAMDKMYWLSSDLGTQISEKRTAIRKAETAKFNQEMAARRQQSVEDTSTSELARKDNNRYEKKSNRDTTEEGDIFFEDVDQGEIYAAKNAIENEKTISAANSDAAISSEANQMVERKRQSVQALAAGLNSVAVGMHQAHQQSKAFEAQNRARIDEQNRRMKQIANDTMTAQARKKEAFHNKYGDIYGQTAYAAQGKQIPGHMLAKQNPRSSYGSGNTTSGNKNPVRSAYNQSSGNAASQQQVTKTTLRHFTIFAKKQLTRADGIPFSKGDMIGRFDGLVGYRYGQYTAQKSVDGTAIYLPASSLSTYDRAKKMMKEGLAGLRYNSEKVVLADGKVVPEDIYKKGTAQMNSIRKKLKKKGISTSKGSWQ